MRYAFGPLIKRKQAITYIDDILLQAKDKLEIFTIVREYHSLLRKAKLKVAPNKTMFFLRKVKFLGHGHLYLKTDYLLLLHAKMIWET